MPRRGITVYLPPDLTGKVERIARDQHRSESSVIADAVRTRWDRQANGAAAEEPTRRALSRVDARLDKAIGETLILKEMLLLFVRVWLEHNPPLDPHLEASAAASAEARFERFLDYVAEALTGGRSQAGAHLMTGSAIGASMQGAAAPPAPDAQEAFP